MISALVVMQGNLGGKLGASLDRLMAAVAGAMAGAACVYLRENSSLPEALVLTLAVGPTALHAALRPSFRLAPITAVIVLVGVPPGAGLPTAVHRVWRSRWGVSSVSLPRALRCQTGRGWRSRQAPLACWTDSATSRRRI